MLAFISDMITCIFYLYDFSLDILLIILHFSAFVNIFLVTLQKCINSKLFKVNFKPFNDIYVRRRYIVRYFCFDSLFMKMYRYS